MCWRTMMTSSFLLAAALTLPVLAGCAATNAGTDGSGMVAAVPRWKIPESWRRLRQGMSEEDVMALLGSPDRKEFGRWRTYWRYGKASGGPQVIFSVDTRKVDTWDGPKR